MDNGSSAAQDMPDNADTRKYMDKMSQVRALKDSITIYGRSLDEQRARFATSEDENERTSLTAAILRGEQRLPALQDSLQAAVAQRQQIEMDFLFKGVVIDPEKVLAKADREVVGASSAYTGASSGNGDRETCCRVRLYLHGASGGQVRRGQQDS